MKSQFKKASWLILLSCTFLFYLWLAAQIPYMHDDWDWGLAPGLTHLIKADINSRYAGNLVEVILTRSPLLKTFFMAAVFTLIPYVMAEIVLLFLDRTLSEKDGGMTRSGVFVLANAVILLMPVTVWRQTCGWVAGFSNFVVSGLLLLLYFLLLMRNRERMGEKTPAAVNGLLFVFGVLIQLFIENLAFYFFLASLFAVLRRVLKKERVGALLLCLLCGNALGLLLVFSSGVYRTLWETGKAIGGYRQLQIDREASVATILRRLFERVCTVVLPDTVKNSDPLPALILCGMLAVCLNRCRAKKSGRLPLILLALLHALLACYYVYLFFSVRYGFRLPVLEGLESRWSRLPFVLYLVLITADLFCFFRRDRRSFSWLLAVWLSPLILLAPMAVINTLGPRSFFTSNICYTLFLLLLTVPLFAGMRRPFRRALGAAAVICLIACFARYGRVYAQIGSVVRERAAVIRSAQNGESDRIELPAFPHPWYLWFPDPGGSRIAYFRAFYGIPEQVEFTIRSEDA